MRECILHDIWPQVSADVNITLKISQNGDFVAGALSRKGLFSSASALFENDIFYMW